MKFKTANSEYELDISGKCIRRLAGVASPTARQGKDGNWRGYKYISDVVVGLQVIITYDNSEPLLRGSPEGATPATVTSPVVSITNE